MIRRREGGKRMEEAGHPVNFVDLTGKKFQSWTVEGLSHSKGWRLFWNCRCDCGNKRVIRGDHLRRIAAPYCEKCKPRNSIISIETLPDDMVARVRAREEGIYRNTFIVDSQLVYGYTSNEECFLFDQSDIEVAKRHTWIRKHFRDGWYVYAVVEQKFTYFHTLIMDNQDCIKRIDHINGDKLDNRRENLRFCCDQQNAFNQRISKRNTLGYKGLAKHASGKWNAIITFCQIRISLGLYDTKREAAAAYDAAAELLFGEFCRLNRDIAVNVPRASNAQKAYVVGRCLKRLHGAQWDQNPGIVNVAIERLYKEQEKLGIQEAV